MGLVEKLPLGRHKAMERFEALFCGLCGVALVALAACMWGAVTSAQATLGEQALYTESFSTSRTDVSGEVVGVYRNGDATRAFVLVRYDSTDLVSADASAWWVALSGSDSEQSHKTLEKAVDGAWYVFGTTGYAGAYLSCPDGFDSQILDMIVVNGKELGDGQERTDESEAEAEIFNQFDAYRVYFNPGAEGATLCAALEEGVVDVTDLYTECVLAPRLAEARESLEAQLVAMRDKLVEVDEYSSRLVNVYGLKAPEEPEYVAGDEVVEGKDGRLQLVSAASAEDAIAVDWRDAELDWDWFSEVLSEDESKSDFLMAHTGSSPVKVGDSATVTAWTMADGTSVLDYTNGAVAGSDENLASDCQLLVTAWQDYADLKYDYETELVRPLLTLELERSGVAATASVNAGEGAVRTW